MNKRIFLWFPCLILLLTSGVWAQTLTLLDSSYIRQEARLLFRWGHTNSNQVTPLTYPGTDSVTALQSQNNASPGADEQRGTTTYSGTDEKVFTVESQHFSDYYSRGGFLNSFGVIHIQIDQPMVYSISGSFTTQTATGKLFVHIKNIDTEDVILENNQDGNDLDVSGGTPTGNFYGLLPAGKYEFYVLMQSYRDEFEQNAEDLIGSGAVSLTLNDDPVVLRPESYIRQLARVYHHWGHTNGNTTTPLTSPGSESLTVLQSSNNAEPGDFQQTGTIAYDSADPGIFNFEADHSSVYTYYGAFIQSEGLLYFDVTTPLAYEVNGSFITETNSGLLNVYLRDINDSESNIFQTEQEGSELYIDQGLPDSDRIGILMPGSYEFYVNMRSDRESRESYDITKVGSGEITLKILPAADVDSISITAPSPYTKTLWGQELGIEWNSTEQTEGAIELSYSVDREYSWIPIALTENTGSYTWTIPEVLTRTAAIKVNNALRPDVSSIARNIRINKCAEYLPGDINKDCYVDLGDFSLLAAAWLECVNPYDELCQ